jgi:hypothetical protein
VIVEVFLSRSNPHDSLPQQLFDSEFNRTGTAIVGEGINKRSQNSKSLLDFLSFVSFEQQLLPVTQCTHETASCCERKFFLQDTYVHEGGLVPSLHENFGLRPCGEVTWDDTECGRTKPTAQYERARLWRVLDAS